MFNSANSSNLSALNDLCSSVEAPANMVAVLGFVFIKFERILGIISLVTAAEDKHVELVDARN